jgi:hypothetical protein
LLIGRKGVQRLQSRISEDVQRIGRALCDQVLQALQRGSEVGKRNAQRDAAVEWERIGKFPGSFHVSCARQNPGAVGVDQLAMEVSSFEFGESAFIQSEMSEG